MKLADPGHYHGTQRAHSIAIQAACFFLWHTLSGRDLCGCDMHLQCDMVSLDNEEKDNTRQAAEVKRLWP